MYFGGREQQEKRTEVDGWREITGVWRASLSLHQCQALSAALRYYQEVIPSPSLSVCHSLCLSPSFLLTEMKEPLSFAVALCFCFSLAGPLPLAHILFTLPFQGAVVHDFENKTRNKPVPFAWNNYMQHCCLISDAADNPGSGPLKYMFPWLISKTTSFYRPSSR